MLYDMSKDPKQHRNLADNPEYAAVRKQLHERLMTRITDARK